MHGVTTTVREWLAASLAEGVTLLGHSAARWGSAVLWGEAQHLLGLDQDPLIRAQAIRRFWTLALADYLCLEEGRERLR